MATERLPRPRDPTALAKQMGDIATGQVRDEVADGSDPATSKLRRLFSRRGGRATADRRAAQRRTEIARAAVKMRYVKKK